MTNKTSKQIELAEEWIRVFIYPKYHQPTYIRPTNSKCTSNDIKRAINFFCKIDLSNREIIHLMNKVGITGKFAHQYYTRDFYVKYDLPAYILRYFKEILRYSKGTGSYVLKSEQKYSYEEMKKRKKEHIQEWIKMFIKPVIQKKFSKYNPTSYGLKHCIETEIGIYVSNEEVIENMKLLHIKGKYVDEYNEKYPIPKWATEFISDVNFQKIVFQV